jgi:putative ABC transport system permease protein
MSWRRFLRRTHRDAEVAREIDSYIEIETDENVARGMSQRDARAAAVRKFGNPTRVREDVYEMNSINPLDSLWQDLRYAVRVLRREKLFACAAILSLTLGIGANTAIFQLLDAVRLRTLPVADAQQLVEVKIGGRVSRTGWFNGRRPNLTYAIYEQVLAQQQSLLKPFAWSSRRFNTSPAGEVHYVDGLFVSGEYFSELRVPPLVGRVLTAADDQRGCGANAAVISYAFWQREMGGDAAVLSRTISLDGFSFPIVGVTPSWFFGMEVGRMYDVAVPLCADDVFNAEESRFEQRSAWWLAAAGRLKPGWTLERATEQLIAISPHLFEVTQPSNYGAKDAASYRAFRLNALPAATGVSTLRTDFEEPLTVLLVTTGLVLLIACANLANLLLARSSARGREIAVRLAVGAARRRVVRQLLVESAVLACTGAILGSLFAAAMSRGLVGVLAAGNPSVFVDLSWNLRLLAFTSGVAFLACLLFGVAPALRATALAPVTALKTAGRGLTDGRERFGLRRGLVVTQVALSLVLLLGALLFSRTLYNLLATDPGFRHKGVLVATVSHLSRSGPATRERQQLTRRELRERLAALPEVASLAQADIIPLGNIGFWNEGVTVDGFATEPKVSNFNRVSRGFFATLEIPLVMGRDFDDRDTLQSPPVAIVSQQFVKDLVPDGAPLGRTVRVSVGPGQPQAVYEIVGVVKDTLLTTLRADIQPMVYVASTQESDPGNGTRFVIKPRHSAAAAMPAVTRAVAEYSPAVNLEFGILDASIRESLLRERLMAVLSSIFGVLAGVLAAIGLYGVMSYTVARRSNEIGIRMAMGAERSDVIRMVLREAALLVAGGLTVGAVLALLAASSARSLLFGLEPHDPATVAGAIGVLSAIGLIAGWLPAYRASRLDPSVTLRNE